MNPLLFRLFRANETKVHELNYLFWECTTRCMLRCRHCGSDCSVQSREKDMPLEDFLGALDTIPADHRPRDFSVVLTGGEPLLRKDITDFLKRIRALGFAVKLDTNGNHPEELKALLAAGLLDYVAMDIKNSPGRYAETVGLETFDIQPVDRSIRLLINQSVPYEFRTTVVRPFHDEASFSAIGPWIAGAAQYFLQEFVDRDTVPCAGLSGFSKEEMEAFVEKVRPFVENTAIRGQ